MKKFISFTLRVFIPSFVITSIFTFLLCFFASKGFPAMEKNLFGINQSIDEEIAEGGSIYEFIMDKILYGVKIDLDDLEEDVPVKAGRFDFTAGEAFTKDVLLCIAPDGANGPKLYAYNADSTDTATSNDGRRMWLKAMEASTGDGDIVEVRVLFGEVWIERNDTLTFTAGTHEGSSTVVTDDGNGWETYFSSAPSGAADHVEFVSVVVRVQNAGLGHHDVVAYLPSLDFNVIPTP